MSLLGDLSIDERWYSFESPMFGFVNPNDICPKETLLSDYNLQADEYDNLAGPVTTIQPGSSRYQGKVSIKPDLNNIDGLEQDPLLCQTSFQETQNLISEPAVLVSCDAQQIKLPLQQHLHHRKELVLERQRRLKEHFDSQPLPKLPPMMGRSGKKLSGRERQIELERQETYQLQLREQYVNLIDQLQQKCEKLRELLGNIVAASPVYNDEMMQYLEENDLLAAQEEFRTNILRSTS